jgi:hypothetical protein
LQWQDYFENSFERLKDFGENGGNWDLKSALCKQIIGPNGFFVQLLSHISKHGLCCTVWLLEFPSFGGNS